MTKEFLSICIPTYNRPHLLRDLLNSIASEITAGGFTPDDVKVYLSDNASTDNTRAVIHEILGSFPHLVYTPNPTNIGGDRNILACYHKSHGHYRWIIGDDEILPAGALAHIIHVLRTEHPAWFINNGGEPRSNKAFNPPRTFSSAKEFMHITAQVFPESLMQAGFISGNIFREDCFDLHFGLQAVEESNYSQFFALLRGLSRQGGTVYFTSQQTLIVRPERPAPAGRLPFDSDINWQKCMTWVRTEFDLPDLDVNLHSKLVSRGIFKELIRHPFHTFSQHRAFFLIPGAYPRMLKRLYWLFRSS